MATTNIYILKLQNNKYYVGKSNNIEMRFQQHLSGKGSTWTKIYKPISIEKIISNASTFDEDKFVKEYMSKYGIDNVRGGTYVSEELEEIQRYNLQKEIWGAKDLCTKCGRKGHFIKECYARTDVDGYELESLEDEIWGCEYCEKEFESETECEKHEKYCKNKRKNNKDTCYRCGRTGHYSTECYARTDVDGYELDSD